MSDAMARHDSVPWNGPKEWALWFVALLIATFFIHNFVRIGKRRMGIK